MNDAPRYVNLRDYLRVLRRQRVLIVSVMLFFGGVALLLSFVRTPVYKAETLVKVADPFQDADIVGLFIADQQLPEQRAASAAAEILSTDVAERVAQRLRLRVEPREFLRSITARAEAQTNFVVIEAEAGSPELSARVADTFARVYRNRENRAARAALTTQIDSLERQIDRIGRPDDTVEELRRTDLRGRLMQYRSLQETARAVTIARAAELPETPYSPKPLRDTILGLGFGLTLGLMGAFLRDSLDRRLRSRDEIQAEIDLPVIGHLVDDLVGRPLVGSEGALEGTDLEAFRIMRATLDFLDVDDPPATVLVTSALPEEGKSTVAAGLAAAMALTGHATLLVECDLRRPILAQRLGLPDGPGLGDYLAGKAEPHEIVRAVDLQALVPSSANGSKSPILACITAGICPPRAAELLASKRFATFLSEVREVYDHVVLDSPPLLAVSDSRQLVPQVDGVLLCLRATRITRDQARAARTALAQLPDKPSGLVITGMARSEAEEYGSYAYAYGYGHETPA